MDWNRVEGNWKQLKGKIKEQWGKLTDDDLEERDRRLVWSSDLVTKSPSSAGLSFTADRQQ